MSFFWYNEGILPPLKNKNVKQKGLYLATGLIFALSLYLAYQQGYLISAPALTAESQLSSGASSVTLVGGMLSAFGMGFVQFFDLFNSILGGNLLISIIVLALVVELITLFASVSIQLKQKKIHLFHKKLVDRFKSGELAMSDTKRELDILYSVNERIHARGGMLVLFQLIVFSMVLLGLYLVSGSPDLMRLANADLVLFLKPATFYLPVLVALGYLLHSFIKIHIKQREDYIGKTQIVTAILFAIVRSTVVFFFAANFALLISIYLVTQISFSTARYLIVESKSKAWGKLAQRELIGMLREAKKHKNKVEHASRKFHHMAFARHLNYHLLEEAASMTLAFGLVLVQSGLL